MPLGYNDGPKSSDYLTFCRARRQRLPPALRSAWPRVPDALLVGILPLAGAGFLVWIIYKSLASAPASEVWSVVGIVATGVI
jgi:hypothetical protein